MGKVQISCLANSANAGEYKIGCSIWVEIEDEEVSIRTSCLIFESTSGHGVGRGISQVYVLD